MCVSCIASEIRSAIGRKSAILIPQLLLQLYILMPQLSYPSKINFVDVTGMAAGYHMVKKYDDMLRRFDSDHDCDRRTDRQTDVQKIALLCIGSAQSCNPSR